jgi:hypothetical protein
MKNHNKRMQADFGELRSPQPLMRSVRRTPMRRTIILLAAVLLLSCSAEKRAHVECACPKDKPKRYQIGITAPTGDWEFNIHAFLHETIRTFEIHLPGKPPSKIEYPFSELKLFETTFGSSDSINLTGGYIRIDMEGKELIISLGTDHDIYWADETYPLHVWSF